MLIQSLREIKSLKRVFSMRKSNFKKFKSIKLHSIANTFLISMFQADF
jgi:hypothetical protein